MLVSEFIQVVESYKAYIRMQYESYMHERKFGVSENKRLNHFDLLNIKLLGAILRFNMSNVHGKVKLPTWLTDTQFMVFMSNIKTIIRS